MTDLEKHAVFLCGFITGTYDLKGGDTLPDSIKHHINAIMWQPEAIGERVTHEITTGFNPEQVLDKIKIVKKEYNLAAINDPVWPKDKEQRLIEMKESGIYTLEDIENELGRTRRQINTKWSHMNRKRG